MTAEPVETAVATTWAVDAQIRADALAQAIPYTDSSLIPDVAERAWAARVQAAVNGMDVVDPQGMDAWMQGHAESPTPHLHEADLVAAYETQVRDTTAALEASWQASMDAHQCVPDDQANDHADEL